MKEKIVLNPILRKELNELGTYLRLLRRKRQFTLTDMCERIGANPRTVGKVEKGDPSVSLGIFMEYLNILGLSQGVARRILGDYLLMISDQKKKRVFTDDEMNF